jgi:iron(III) transport system substrate-binding protein
MKLQMKWEHWRCWLVACFCLLVLTGCGGSSANQELVIYSSRTQSLIQPLLEQFAEQTGINIRVRYANTTSLIATLLG